MDSSKKYSNVSPETTTNFVSKLCFCWVLPFFKFGYQNDLQVKDIYNATQNDLSGSLTDKLERNWQKEIKRASQEDEKPSLKRAIFKTFVKSYSLYGVCLFLQAVIIRSLLPIVLAAYIRYFDNSASHNISTEQGWALGLGVIFLSIINVVTNHHSLIGCQRVGMRVRIACCSLIYRKLLKLSPSSLGKTAAGQIINLLSNDVGRFDIASTFLHYYWIMPIQFVVAFYVMYRSVGVATLAGMTAITLQAIPLQGYLSKLQGKLRYKIALRTDNRIKLMNEIISGIQVIKMYAWEKPFEKIVEIARKHEIDFVTKTSYIKGYTAALAVSTERFTLYLTMVTYVLIGNTLTGDVVFSMAQLFNSIQLYMTIFFPNALSTYAEAKVTIKRLEEFLLLDENKSIVKFTIDDTVAKEKRGEIKIINASASWIENPILDTLRDINLDIKPGTLCCIVGNVGSGKSSILQMILKELPLKHGTLDIVGNVSYASQDPWLFASSVRNNILFGQSYNKNRYASVVKVCALERDFRELPFGDKTLAGERGVSLSGGQTARINLARAVYLDADIYLFDDPLSAVDTHVGKHLFEECIIKYLGDKTRVLVTHQLQFLKQADVIVVVNNGQIENVGTYNVLSENVLKNIEPPQKEKGNEIQLEPQKRERLQSFTSVVSSIDKNDEPEETQELIEKGAIPFSTYVEYWRAGANNLYLLFLAALFIIGQIACNAFDMWVAIWTNNEEQKNSQNITTSVSIVDGNITETPLFNFTTTNLVNFQSLQNSTDLIASDKVIPSNESDLNSQAIYIIIYTILIIAVLILTAARCLVFYQICMNASKALHNKMFSNILKAPMRFFDTNPSGRILNRFSKDMGAVDEILPPAMLSALIIFLLMIGIIMMVFIVTPWMIAPTAVLGYLYIKFREIYLTSAQDVKRLEGVTRAPVFSHVSSSLRGLSTIRASNAQKMVANEFDVLQDQHTSTWFMLLACSEAFGFYLDVISTIFLAFVTLQFLIFNSENSYSGNVGLSISSTLILTGMLQMGVRQSAEVASNITSVERILQYTALQREGADIPPKKPEKIWPQFGKITFKGVYLSYASEEPAVLKNLNIVILPGEKIGIVGRTGAGKSSLISALFRLAPIEGVIDIDDIDIATIGLEDLRSRISIIPQKPVLFSASIRYNLDPFKSSSDEELWKALDNVELKGTIDSLDQEVNEGGSNFSSGQRQLMCLARAIVRNNKVLVMDEATANVDSHTDSLIQKTIRESFKDCTVLTIAHRLNTIMDSDKVLVMDSGQAVEFAHPHQLLQIKDGYFARMVSETGSTMEASLRKLAEEAFEEMHRMSVITKIDDAMTEIDL